MIKSFDFIQKIFVPIVPSWFNRVIWSAGFKNAILHYHVDIGWVYFE